MFLPGPFEEEVLKDRKGSLFSKKFSLKNGAEEKVTKAFGRL